MKKIKSQAAQLLANPMAAIVVVFLVIVLLGGGAVLLFTGGDDEKGETAKTTTAAKKAKKGSGAHKAKRHKIKRARVVNGTGRLDVARSEGRLAIAQARGRIKNPSGVSIRVSAAPKQTVTVDWLLACYKPSGTRTAHGRYRTRPPNVRALPLPLSGAVECTATVGAQLTKNLGSGRIKVAVIAG
ncbi:MAG: hypothetical protein QOG94_2784 [Solirubrobacteraceae bacterium]|nr:hypothetical protein [Solirubrobacteraceae bacterium]